ncbi:ComEA family DNA-binding protein [Haemophilus paraphrohaemolyticus]|uniref:Competence protein ComEA helix-hairpin-helix repeat region n=1 Tax=Haemophilus paraphrohaemolyticus HK411 TaxID=1095743 RepID=I2NIE3_9PAST|nr:ComEA family DNA-binding protein [Haemophilus paraphrohaemolyticus]EIG25604.1 competence protein ComEA helix-hairpin-helix repeat region [Haemophilus paraphrohaemolyticus HK411]OOR95225.1 transporter [Haemophilus paraphrohaemolyticus]STP00773.1 competence protein ComEA helix-hairpin-helix repeat region [Haemophilus paraphrohaemolyticus]
MKKINTFATSLMIGLFSTAVFANEVTTQPAVQPVQTTVVTAPAASTAPVSIQQVAVDPNAVNINTASAAEIQDKLVGIGAKKAQAIVDYRTKNGAFLSIEQLKEVSGIGAATVEKNRSRIVL